MDQGNKPGCGSFSHVLFRNMDGCQVGLDHAADRLVVKAYDGHILRNAQPVLL